MMMNRYIYIGVIIIGVAFIFVALYALITTMIEVKHDNTMMNNISRCLTSSKMN